MTTFQHQGELQKLPIPPLEDTCARYLKVLAPLQTEREHERTVEAVQQFLKDGTGKYLDSELRKYSRTRNSYIEQFWYDSYLNYDSPVVLNLNPYFLLEDDPFNNDSMTQFPQEQRAASLILSLLKFIRALKNETLPVDTIRGKPLCMYQYQKLFGASRIPSDDGCLLQLDPNSHHIVVMSKSQFYWFDVLDNNNDILLSEKELVVNFKSIIHDSQQVDSSDIAKLSFGVLTTENRRIWAKIRSSSAIVNNEVNRDILNIIDSSLFILCLDDCRLENLSDLAQNMLCGMLILDEGIQIGTCTNRWYDKLQIIVTENGKAGINFEHTGVDGHTVLRFVSDIYTDSILLFARSINGNAPSLWHEDDMKGSKSPVNVDDLVTIPRKLEWELTPDLLLALRFGETRLSDLINQNEFKHLEFKNYGSSQIKKMKYSPDAFAQMAFQATYYALYGKVECTYEPAMTKQFFHGRTEAIRTVSQELNLFVRKFFESDVPNELKLKYLLDACVAHSAQTKLASNGNGVDRHLYALFCIWKRYLSDDLDEDQQDEDLALDVTLQGSAPDKLQELPSIFADAGWDRLNNTIISSSNCGNPSLRLFGFGPVLANGFGLGYIIKDDLILICAASKHRQTDRFLVTLELYLNEILRIFHEVNDSPKLVHPIPKTTRPEPIQPIQQSIKEPLNGTAPVPMADPVPIAAPTAKPIAQPLASLVGNLNELEPTISPSMQRLTTLLGGYGYFDMGDEDIKSRGQSPEPPFLHRQNSGFSIREITKKLRLSEY